MDAGPSAHLEPGVDGPIASPDVTPMPAAADPDVRPPRQARSRATYQRLLDAAEALMAEQSFDDTTVAAIVEHAGLSAGAFYARFRDKEGLFRHLEERAFDEVRDVVAGVLAALPTTPTRPDAASRDPADLFARLIASLAAAYQRRRSLIRAVLLRAHADPALRDRLAALNRENQARVASVLRTALLVRGADPATCDAQIEFAQLATRSVLRSAIVFQETFSDRPPLDPIWVSRETARMVAAYLALPSPPDQP